MTMPSFPHKSPFYKRTRQDFALIQERQRHTESLFHFGEYAAFILMWRLEDHERGLVDRCSRCFAAGDLIADVYKQPKQNKCPICFGTTFEGGYKAILIRPSIWDINETDTRLGSRGEQTTQNSSVQSTNDFRLRTGDYIARNDGVRYQMRTMASNQLRTGFSHPNRQNAVVGYNYGTVGREDPSSVAYLLPPTEQVLADRLAPSTERWPTTFHDIEIVRGPVL